MSGRKILKRVLIICIIVFIGGYGLFQARKIIAGPRIAITTPINGAGVSQPDIVVEGTAKNVAFLYFNNKKIFTDDAGIFSINTIVATGTNMLELKAEDKFGNEVREVVTIYRNN